MKIQIPKEPRQRKCNLGKKNLIIKKKRSRQYHNRWVSKRKKRSPSIFDAYMAPELARKISLMNRSKRSKMKPNQWLFIRISQNQKPKLNEIAKICWLLAAIIDINPFSTSGYYCWLVTHASRACITSRFRSQRTHFISSLTILLKFTSGLIWCWASCASLKIQKQIFQKDDSNKLQFIT